LIVEFNWTQTPCLPALIPVQVDDYPMKSNSKEIREALLCSSILVATIRETHRGQINTGCSDMVDWDSAG